VSKLPPERPGPEGGKRDRNRRERTEALRAAGLALFLEGGIEAVTIDEIARRAGMAKGNFYRYFDDKRHLVDSLIAPIRTHALAAVARCADAIRGGADANAAYGGLAMDLAQLAPDHLEVFRLIIQEHRAPPSAAREGIVDFEAQLTEAAVQLTELAVGHGLLRVRDPRVSTLAVLGAIENLALALIRGRLETPVAEVGPVLVELVLDGLRPR